MSAEPVDQPTAHVRVVRGRPDDDELAALVTGLLAATLGPRNLDEQGIGPGGWTDRTRGLRGWGVPRHGPDAWRWSLRG